MGYNPSYKWINPTYPIYNWGYNPLTKWDEPPSTRTSLQAFSRAPNDENGLSNGGGAKCRWPQPRAVARWFPNAEALQLWGERWCRSLDADGEPKMQLLHLMWLNH